MFQTYENNCDSENSGKHISHLRDLLKQKNLDGYIVPLSDEHQSEYIADYAKRLAWLTGFTGSAGMALILAEKAVFFTDGRYKIQVRQQTDNNIFEYIDFTETPVSEYIKANCVKLRIGIDPALLSVNQAKAIAQALESTDGALIFESQNLIDLLWQDQPSLPCEQVENHPLDYAGQSVEDKIAQQQAILAEKGLDNAIIADLTSIAWLFNIRGKDIGHTPVTLAFAIIRAESSPILFIDKAKITNLGDLSGKVEIEPYENFYSYLKNLSAKKESFLIDPNSCSCKVNYIIHSSGGVVEYAPDPIKLPKAIKNSTEISGSKKAHIRDGVAMVRFLHWLENQDPGSITEIDAAIALENFRAKTADFFSEPLRDISFDTISGAGSNGAIIHYRVTKNTNKILGSGELYLVDSGAQYRDGTTDITRTVPIGNVCEDEKLCFTLVLKGMIQLSMAKFKAGTKGMHLDILARQPLLQYGLDYAHGTGHGIGSYLAVHEGPQNISKFSEQILLPNMIISNEPGCYKQGKFGIRIENLIIVRQSEQYQDILEFETITMCPISKRLVKKELLTKNETEWLNNYHSQVRANLMPMLEDMKEFDAANWLTEATSAI